MKDNFYKRTEKYFKGEIEEKDLYKYYFQDLYSQIELLTKKVRYMKLFALGALTGMVLLVLIQI